MSRGFFKRSNRRLRGRKRILARKKRKQWSRIKKRLFLSVITVFALALIVFGISAFVRGCSLQGGRSEADIMGPFIPEDALWIDGVSWIFREQDTSVPLTRVSGQWIQILEQDGNWYRVDAAQGIGWMRRNFSPSPEGIDTLIGMYGSSLGIYFENLETGFVFQSNGGQDFYSASTMKAVHAFYLYQQAEQGYIDLSEYIFTYQRGSRVSLTVDEALRLNISESDNAASNSLANRFGVEGYRSFIDELGAEVSFQGNRVMNHALTPRDAGLFMREIFAYIESDGRYSQDFKNHLLDNQYPFIVSDYPVASKTGWFPPYAWHDMAIVYAESPYILVILAARSGWNERDYREFAEISMAFQEFNRKWFVE